MHRHEALARADEAQKRALGFRRDDLVVGVEQQRVVGRETLVVQDREIVAIEEVNASFGQIGPRLLRPLGGLMVPTVAEKEQAQRALLRRETLDGSLRVVRARLMAMLRFDGGEEAARDERKAEDVGGELNDNPIGLAGVSRSPRLVAAHAGQHLGVDPTIAQSPATITLP